MFIRSTTAAFSAALLAVGLTACTGEEEPEETTSQDTSDSTGDEGESDASDEAAGDDDTSPSWSEAGTDSGSTSDSESDAESDSESDAGSDAQSESGEGSQGTSDAEESDSSAASAGSDAGEPIPTDAVDYADALIRAWGVGDADRMEELAPADVVDALGERGGTHWDQVADDAGAGSAFVSYENTEDGSTLEVRVKNEAASQGEEQAVSDVKMGE